MRDRNISNKNDSPPPSLDTPASHLAHPFNSPPPPTSRPSRCAPETPETRSQRNWYRRTRWAELDIPDSDQEQENPSPTPQKSNRKSPHELGMPCRRNHRTLSTTGPRLLNPEHPTAQQRKECPHPPRKKRHSPRPLPFPRAWNAVLQKVTNVVDRSTPPAHSGTPDLRTRTGISFPKQ